MKIKLILLAFLLTITTTILADYIMGPPERYLANKEIVVIDATIEEITAEGHAKLKVHELIVGKKSPTLLKEISLSCKCPPLATTGMKKGKRYIFVTTGENLYEGSTLWEVLKSFDGELKCYYAGSEDKTLKNTKVNMPPKGLYDLAEFKKQIKAVAAAGRRKE